jgi:hypothetical protein
MEQSSSVVDDNRVPVLPVRRGVPISGPEEAPDVVALLLLVLVLLGWRRIAGGGNDGVGAVVIFSSGFDGFRPGLCWEN